MLIWLGLVFAAGIKCDQKGFHLSVSFLQAKSFVAVATGFGFIGVESGDGSAGIASNDIEGRVAGISEKFANRDTEDLCQADDVPQGGESCPPSISMRVSAGIPVWLESSSIDVPLVLRKSFSLTPTLAILSDIVILLGRGDVTSSMANVNVFNET